MSNWIIALAALLAAGILAVHQRDAAASARRVNRALESELRVLRERADGLARRQAGLERQLGAAREQVRQVRAVRAQSVAAAAETSRPADAGRPGGWKASGPDCYLPKRDLAAVGFPLFEGGRLSEAAVTLFGMTRPEREAVEAAYDNLWRKFRDLEIERMELVATPEEWQPAVENSLSYRIPALGTESAALGEEFFAALGQALGAGRAEYLGPVAGAYLQQNLDDLGQTARIISFGQKRQPDGEVQFVYGVITEGISRALEPIREPLPEDSQAAYYARLLGIAVPIKGQ